MTQSHFNIPKPDSLIFTLQKKASCPCHLRTQRPTTTNCFTARRRPSSIVQRLPATSVHLPSTLFFSFVLDPPTLIIGWKAKWYNYLSSRSSSNMQTPPSLHKISVSWRGKTFIVEMKLGATVKELGQELQKLTNIQEDTMRLIISQVSNKTSKLISPFSTQHAFSSLEEASIGEAKSIKMMGVLTNEVEQVLQDAKTNLRIAGFEDDERRLKQRSSYGPHFPLKLPQGPYIFTEFKTLEIPGVTLSPPPSEALKRMHMLAADPGIVAVMNKHRWRVGIMTEMAPIGYVGVSPKCILGFNKNHGEEISLRLRTDDLKGFRKYESIKKTLLHELAHMVYSEHDAQFYALDKQLNQEAASLDWTRSASHTLSGVRNTDYFEDVDVERDSANIPHTLGGNQSDQLISARASSVTAAYHRMINVSANKEPDPDDSSHNASYEPDDLNSKSKEIIDTDMNVYSKKEPNNEPYPNDHVTDVMKHEPHSDDSHHVKAFGSEVCSRITDTDELDAENNSLEHTKCMVSDSVDSGVTIDVGPQVVESRDSKEYAHDEHNAEVVLAEPDPDDEVVLPPKLSTVQTDEPDPDDQEIKRINDPVTVVCNRLQKALEVLTAEVSPVKASSVLQILLKIIRNVIEHPEEMKYRRLRKVNPVIERNIINNKAALEILFLVGFKEDVVMDELGKTEAYLVLKRNDPGLLWLAKSSIESCT